MTRGSRCVVVVLAVVLLGGSGPPGLAHVGGRVELFVSGFKVDASDGGSTRAHVSLIDADSAEPAPGFNVQVRATDASGRSIGPVTLADPGSVGEYVGELPMEPGEWTVDVLARELPGGEEAIPFDKSWDVTVDEDGGITVGGSAEGGTLSNAFLPVGVGLVAVVGVLLVRLRRRQRSRVQTS